MTTHAFTKGPNILFPTAMADFFRPGGMSECPHKYIIGFNYLSHVVLRSLVESFRGGYVFKSSCINLEQAAAMH